MHIRIRSRKILSLLLLLPLLTLALHARAEDDLARIDTILGKSASRHEFMGTVLIARDGKVVLNKGYGYANLEWDVKNTSDTKFRIGSVTKQFTAAAILLLEERGKLTLDDPIGKYLPDAPAAWSKVTLLHLLTHTSGILNFNNLPDIESWARLKTTPIELIDRLRNVPMEFAPGDQWSYSNSGYLLLGYVIEKVSGQRYEDFLQENIFTPLQMHDTGYDHTEQILLHRASGYQSSESGLQNADFTDISNHFAVGSLYSTTEDLLRWENGLYGGHVLSSASLQKMTTPHKGDYGFGIFVRKLSGKTIFDHAGDIQGFSSEMNYFPEEKLTVIVLGNVLGEAAHELAARIDAIELSVGKR